jgi:hypothetical protein
MISRLAVLLHLVLLAAALIWWLPGSCAAQGGAAPAKEGKVMAAAADVPVWQPAEPVEGYGQTEEEAVQRALARARDLVEDYLRRQSPPVRWTPKVEYVRDRLLRGQPQRRADLDKEVDVGNAKIKVRCWTISVSIRQQDREAIAQAEYQQQLHEERLEQDHVAQGRMVLLAKLLAGAVAVLLAVAAYIRLDDLTKGYYSRWLAAAAAGLLTAVGLGVWICS